ncbi:MAG: ASPIC/UnbV domain-containing protein [Thermoanaerobaculia bacterium]|nr:ASPIC/UnbV domain-containing protein [Thermoanaerobaculia bacterium]
MTTLTGETLSDVYVFGEGLGSDSTAAVTFGLGNDTTATRLSLHYLDGTGETLDGPEADRTYVAGTLGADVSHTSAKGDDIIADGITTEGLP